MLVLTRKTQQQIQFGSDIVITILQVKGQSVRIGIEAPRGVRVVRGEIASKPPRVATAVADGAAFVESQGPKADGDATTSRLSMNPSAAPTGQSAAAETFSSPASPQPQMAGKSSGLFPRLRQRAQNSLDRKKARVAPRAAIR